MADEYAEHIETIQAGFQLEQSDLSRAIEAASRLFDRLTGREDGYYNKASSSPTARTFYGDGTIYLQLDAFSGSLSTSNLSVPTGYAKPSFITQGYKLVIVDSVGRINKNQNLSGFSRTGWDFTTPEVWEDGLPYTVTTTWGFSAIPADVKQAVIELAIKGYRETDAAYLQTTNMAETPPIRS